MKKYILLAAILLVTIASCQTAETTTVTPTSGSPTHPPIPPTSTTEPFNPSLTVIGESEIVYKWDTDRCADNMLPDLPARAIRDADGMIQLIIPSTTNYRLVGPDFDSLEPDCAPIMLSDQDRIPANYNHSEWLAATYTEDGKTIYAIIHNEYHGDQAGSVWQADLDFSEEQGYQNWSYQSWYGSSYSDMKYNASKGEWTGPRSLCLIAPWGLHPDVGCDPSRTWTSPIDGTVTLSGRVYDAGTGGGNGVVASILKGDEEIWSATLEEGDGAGQSYDFKVDVRVGDQIHFRVNARGNAGWDATFFSTGINIGPAPCPSGRHDVCTLISLSSAVSTDGGKTYTHLPAPNHRVANFPYPYDPDWMRAVWQPSGIVKNPKDGYYYVLIQVDEHNASNSRNIQGMCVMRTKSLDDPSSWRAWDGTGFNMRFINPYLETGANPKDHECVLVAPENSALSYSLTYNTYLDKFVAIGVSGGNRPGFYYSLSDDLIQWTPKKFFMDAVMGFMNGNQVPYDAYPTLIDHESTSLSFDTSGQNAYLYYTIFTNDSPWSMDLMRVRVAFSRGADDIPATPTKKNPENNGKEPIVIPVTQQERVVPADTPVTLTLGWAAKTKDLVAEFIASAQFEILLDGKPLSDLTDHWGDIEPSGVDNFQSHWTYSLGTLEPGQHSVHIKITLIKPVSDGLGYNYDGVLVDNIIQITVEQ